MSQLLWFRNLGAGLLCGSGPGSLIRLWSRCSLGLQSSEGFTWGWVSISKTAHSQGCWQGPRFLSIGLLECPGDQAVHPAASIPRKRRKLQCLLWSSIRSHHHYFLHMYLLEANKSSKEALSLVYTQGEGKLNSTFLREEYPRFYEQILNPPSPCCVKL